ncbi:MAG: RNA polymerase sigma factor, partial [Steroidobacteraceae bacterium]
AYSSSDSPRIERGRGYLFAIARNLLFDAARRRAIVSFYRMADLDTLNVADDAPTAETIVSAQDELRRLQEVVDALSPQCRRVFLLRRIEEHSLHEIAVELGLSVSTVEKHLAKAMASLTQALAESDPVIPLSTTPLWPRTKHRR